MKKIKFNNIIRTLNEAIGFGFSTEYLKQLPTFNAKVKYCKTYLGEPIGNGSSRTVFQLNDEYILKLAKNTKGIYQNEKEGQDDWYRDSYGIFPQVNYDLSDMDNFSFIVSEYVLPVREKDFKVCLGMSSQQFYNFLETSASQHNRKFHKRIDDEEFVNMIENNEELAQWNQYMCDYEAGAYDLRNANFGMTLRDGQPTIVMLDNGVDEDILNRFYKRR